MSIDSTVNSLIAGLIVNSIFLAFPGTSLALDNRLSGSISPGSNELIFTNDEQSAFEVRHVTRIDNEDNDEKDTSAADDKTHDGEVPETDEEVNYEESSSGEAETQGITEPLDETSDNDIEESELEAGQSEEDSQATELSESETEPSNEKLMLLEAPKVPRAKSKSETKTLKKLVYELQYGSLNDSIKLLETMVQSYPYDPDYRDLLKAAKNLRHADIWYQYQRRLQLPPPSAKPKTIYKLIKMNRNEKPINELKQASWFHMIKGRSRLMQSKN